MKNLLFCTVLFAAACGQSDQKNIPDASVRIAFLERFPHAQKVQWSAEEGGIMEATFIQGGRPHSANFALDGTWLETEQEIREQDLSIPLRAKLAVLHPGAIITKAEQVTTPNIDLVEVELSTAAGKVEVMLTPDGEEVPHDAADRD